MKMCVCGGGEAQEKKKKTFEEIIESPDIGMTFIFMMTECKLLSASVWKEISARFFSG